MRGGSLWLERESRGGHFNNMWRDLNVKVWLVIAPIGRGRVPQRFQIPRSADETVAVHYKSLSAISGC
jgi:hypothetical protein